MTITARRGWKDWRPELASFPSEDRAFAREVQASVAREHPASPADLEHALRGRFPRVVVRLRALSDESRETWYVFRDGRVLPA